MGNAAEQQRNFDALERRRFEALLLARRGLSLAQIARDLRVARQTVSRWVNRYRREGKASLRRAGRAGRKPRLDARQLDELKSMLLKGPEAFGLGAAPWTCPRVAQLIESRLGARYHPGHVWKILGKLGISLH